MSELEIIQFHQLHGLNIFVNTVNYRSPHFHNEWELLWVLDAPLKVQWQQKEIILQPGDLAIFPPKLPHEFQKVERIHGSFYHHRCLPYLRYDHDGS